MIYVYDSTEMRKVHGIRRVVAVFYAACDDGLRHAQATSHRRGAS